MQASEIYPSDVAFTPSVKALQFAKGSRDAYRLWRRTGRGRRELPLIWPALSRRKRAFF